MKKTNKIMAVIGGVAVFAGASASAQTLIDQWNFNETSGTTAANTVGGGASASLMGGATFNGSGGVALNGTTGTGISLGSGLLNGLTSVTFEGWFSYTGAANNPLFSFNNNNIWSGTYLRFNLNGHSGNDYIEPISGWGGHVLNGTPLANNTLNHIAVIYDPSASYEAIYVNGSLATSYSGAPADVPALSNYAGFNGSIGLSPWISANGYTPDDPYLNGTIDQFSIYNGALSGSQIAADFAAGPAPVPEPGTCAMLAGGIGMLLAGFRLRKNK